MSFRIHTKCRACEGTDLAPVFDLGVQPLANDHVKPGQPMQGFYTLNVLYCRGCGLAQLSVVVDPKQLYDRYTYVSSSSQTMQRHYDRLYLDILSEQPDKSIVEIASNDGSCLKFFKSKGFTVLGIDPARNICEMAEEQNITTIPSFFDHESAGTAEEVMPHPGVILARHVFSHVDNWREFLSAIGKLATTETLVVLEFPYVLDMIRGGHWDSVYHEHLSVVSLNPIVSLLKSTPFHVHRVIKAGIHQGCLVVMLRHNDHASIPHLSADEYMAEEQVTEKDWKLLALRAKSKIEGLKGIVKKLRDDGKIVCGFGASAKATVLINACGWQKDSIAFVSDNSPLKPGCLIPGTDIPIIEEDQFLSEHPDYAIMMAHNYEKEICAKMEKWRSRGGKFIIPDDALRIV
jgi:C-methyltransferase C-terminal domain/Putative zinc binding domain/Methyltransferase domain